MINLINTDLISDLKNWINSGKSFLGICLGLQLLFESSDEGKVQGLGILKGKIQKIPYIVNQRKELTEAHRPSNPKHQSGNVSTEVNMADNPFDSKEASDSNWAQVVENYKKKQQINR